MARRTGSAAQPRKSFSGEVLLAQVLWARLGGRTAVPRLLEPRRRLDVTARADCAGFLLCRIDGVSTLERLIACSTLPELTALTLASKLVDQGIIEMSAADPPSGVRRAR